MRPRLTLVVIAALVAATAAPSLAATKPKPKGLAAARPLTFTDPAGDANFLNNEGGLVPGAPDDGPATSPAQIASADVLGVTIARLDDKKTVKGITVTMKLSAAPAQATLYRITGAAGNCTVFWFQYNWNAGGTGQGTLRHDCAPSGSPTAAIGDTVTVPIPAVVGPASITWTLPLSAFPAGIKVGTVMEGFVAETRVIIGAGPQGVLTAPVIDQTAPQTSSYKIGQ